jgi:hypothetical protein
MLLSVVVAILGVGMVFGMIAAWLWICQNVWNYIAVSTNHPTWQISFWVTAAIWFLLGVVSSFFRAKKE